METANLRLPAWRELQTYDYRPGAVGGSADGYVLKQNALNSPRGNHHS